MALLGSPDDLGVKRNHGRPGANLGPDTVRKHLFKMTPPLDLEWENKIQLYDGGNIECTTDILKTHKNAKQLVSSYSQAADCLIAIGGGHDFASPHFTGFIEGITKRGGKPPRAGLINIDPHLDVRELTDDLPHSGSPFREILESQCIRPQNLIQFGFRRNRNSRRHLKYCQDLKVTLLPFEIIQTNTIIHFRRALTQLANRCTIIGLTIDMDCCTDAEGTSAAPVIGLSARELCEISSIAAGNKKVAYLELGEIAPGLDHNERSARIGAEIVYSFLYGKANRASGK